MIALGIAGSLGFLICVFGTPILIRMLRRREMGQQIRDDGPFAHPHTDKAGTPTMGGVAIVVAVTIAYLVAHVRTEQLKFSRVGIILMFLIIGFSVVGFIDDYLSLRRGRNTGLRMRGKTGGQLLVAGGFIILALQWVNVSTDLSFTRAIDLRLGTTLWIFLALIVIYGTSNAVNLTDGLDGLAAGSAMLVFLAFTVVCFWEFRHPVEYGIGSAAAVDLAIIAAALAGACGGFLWWNAAPARIFMGDTGSLALGAAMAGLALLSETVLLLPILGGLYVIETLSVIAQVISFRGFGRRVLRMAPIHHHFEVGGMPEFTVLIRLWLFSGACVALGLGIFYADFIRIPGAID